MSLRGLVLGVLAFAVTLAVHELGHLFAGFLVRFRFEFFAFGPVLLERPESGRLRLRFNRIPIFVGGVASTVPTDTANLRLRFAAVLCGGPLASLLLAIAAHATVASSALASPAVRMEAQWLRLLSSAIFLVTALPVRNGPFMTDGLRLIRLFRGGSWAARDLSLLHLMAVRASGQPASQWDPAVVAAGLVPDDGSMFELGALFFAYLRAVDVGDIGQAGAHLDRAIEILPSLPPAFRITSLLEAAYFEAAFRHRHTVAARHLAEVPANPPSGVGFLEADRLRAEAAIAIERGDRPAAIQAIARALDQLQPGALWARARLVDLRARLERAG